MVADADQRQQAQRHIPVQPGNDPGRQRLTRPAQRRADDPIDLPRRRRFQLPCPALRQELLAHQFRASLPLRHIAGQPVDELVLIGHRRGPEPEEPPDLAAVPLVGDAIPLVEAQVPGLASQLPGHELDSVGVELAPAAWEAAEPAVELHHQREPESGDAMLSGDQIKLRFDQRPVLDQIAKVHRGATHRRISFRPLIIPNRSTALINYLIPGRKILKNAPYR